LNLELHDSRSAGSDLRPAEHKREADGKLSLLLLPSCLAYSSILKLRPIRYVGRCTVSEVHFIHEMFPKLDPFTSLWMRGKVTTQLGPLGKIILHHWTVGVFVTGPSELDISHPLHFVTETDPVSKTLCI
jgi:hypothetical protein